MASTRPASSLPRDWALGVAIAMCGAYFAFGESIWEAMDSTPILVLVFSTLFGTVLLAAIRVVHYAERLAERLGDPYGTLILTLSVTAVEVASVAAVMLHGEANPTLARDTLFAVVMIVLNAMVGLSLLIGGWRHREQHHNLQGANVYLNAAIPLVVLSLVLPDYTRTTVGPTLSRPQQTFLVLVSLGLYAAFLAMQTGRHRDYFATNEATTKPVAPHDDGRSTAVITLLLVAYLLPALYLAERLSRPVDYLIETLHAPVALGGVIIAALVATPEAIGAVRAAMGNELQRSINIFLGSVLSTIGITIPSIVIIAEVTNQTLVLGVQHTDLVMLLLTLTVSIVTFSSGRTNVLHGLVHLILFAAYVLLIFQD